MNFDAPKTFQANPSPLKKRIFLVVGLAGIAAIVFAIVAKGKTDYGAHCFAGGITAVVFGLRFYLMMVMHGPAALTFGPDGIILADKASHQAVSWSDLQSIRYRVSRGGHYWEIRSRTQKGTLDFYLDGLTGRQQEELRETVASIALPGVKIVPTYDPFDKAA